MITKVALHLVVCAVVSGNIFDPKLCSTPQGIRGKCLFPRFCPGYRFRIVGGIFFSRIMGLCDFGTICCPKSFEISPHPLTPMWNIQRSTERIDENKNGTESDSGLYSTLRPDSDSKHILKAHDDMPAKSEDHPRVTTLPNDSGEEDEERDGRNVTPQVDTTSTLAANIDQNETQIIFSENCSTGSHGVRIFGGTESKLGELPWMILLEYNYRDKLRMSCSGSLITNWHVLTAAHCVHEQELKQRGLTLRSVRLGEWDISSDPDCVTESAPTGESEKSRCAPKFLSIPVQEVYIHPSYKPWPVAEAGDIALLQLQEPVQFNEYVGPICLPESAIIFSKSTAAGWGRTENLRPSNRLLKVNLPLADRQECESNYRKNNVTLKSSQLCFGELGKDTCVGDSGGPLMQIDDQLEIHVIGIISTGPANCGTTTTAGLYTKVYDYVPWIHDQIRLMNGTEHRFTFRFRKSQTPESDASDKIFFPKD